MRVSLTLNQTYNGFIIRILVINVLRTLETSALGLLQYRNLIKPSASPQVFIWFLFHDNPSASVTNVYLIHNYLCNTLNEYTVITRLHVQYPRLSHYCLSDTPCYYMIYLCIHNSSEYYTIICACCVIPHIITWSSV